MSGLQKNAFTLKSLNDAIGGDCALVHLQHSCPYPPTAQHAIREGSTAAKKIIASIQEKLELTRNLIYNK